MSVSTNFYSTLRSDLKEQKRPFTSIFDCKNKARVKNPFLKEGPNEIRYHMGPYGPLVVEHFVSDKKKKLTKLYNNNKSQTKTKRRYSKKNYVSPFNYFTRHAHCDETKLYWHNIQSPQILRHYTPPRSSDYTKHYYNW